MGLTGIFSPTPGERTRAEQLARTLGVPLLTERSRETDGVILIVDASGLSLAFGDPARGKPFPVTFANDRPLPRANNFRRAFGGCHSIIDATAGLGRDAWRALGWGARVIAIERDPVVFTILEDAVRRGRAEGGAVAERLKNLELVHADATDALVNLKAEAVYLDAMFTKPKQTAKSPKEMQWLQELFGPGGGRGNVTLFEKARAAATERLVVKAPLKAPAGDRRPSHVIAGQSVRFDVYVRSVQ